MLQCGKLDGWTQEKTAQDLGISQQAVAKAIKPATMIEEHPELVERVREDTGQGIVPLET